MPRRLAWPKIVKNDAKSQALNHMLTQPASRICRAIVDFLTLMSGEP